MGRTVNIGGDDRNPLLVFDAQGHNVISLSIQNRHCDTPTNYPNLSFMKASEISRRLFQPADQYCTATDGGGVPLCYYVLHIDKKSTHSGTLSALIKMFKLHEEYDGNFSRF